LRYYWDRYAVIAVPALFAVAGNLLQLIALIYIAAAVLAGLRGVFILMTAVLSTLLAFKDRPRSWQEWLWIAVAGAGALIVGCASALQAQFVTDSGTHFGHRMT
jgi:drug/metabolite transporter (DMT)-like permease